MSKPLIPNLSDPEFEEIKKLLLTGESIRSVMLDEIEIEEITIKEDDEKKLFTYNQSLERLRSDGYERHLRPGEAFNIIIKNLEDKEIKEGKYKEIYKDMLSSYGEWLSLAVERKDNLLICYLDPEGKFFENLEFYSSLGKIRYSEKHAYNIQNLLSNEKINIEYLPPKLTSFLYSKNVDELPYVFQKNGGIILPQEGIIAPVSRKGVSIYSHYEREIKNASRGAKSVHKIGGFDLDLSSMKTI